MTDDWIVVPGWDKFQHYHDRNPTWIKLYLELNSRVEWLELTTAERGMLATIWVEYARSGGVLKVERVMGLCGKSARSKHLESLSHAGFVEVSASKPLAQRREETEASNEASVLKKKEKKERAVENSQKRKAKAWIDNVLPHLEGVDLAYTIADEFHISDQDIVADLIAYAQERMLGRTL